MKFLKSLWLIITNPVHRAEEQYHLAQAKLAAQEAEVRYQISRMNYYDIEGQTIDPMVEWWRFAQYKEKVVEHRKLLIEATNKQHVLRSRYVTYEKKWKQLRIDLAPAKEPHVYTGISPPPSPMVGDVWISDKLQTHTWDGTHWNMY